MRVLSHQRAELELAELEAEWNASAMRVAAMATTVVVWDERGELVPTVAMRMLAEAVSDFEAKREAVERCARAISREVQR